MLSLTAFGGKSRQMGGLKVELRQIKKQAEPISRLPYLTEIINYIISKQRILPGGYKLFM